MNNAADQRFMRLALRLARRALGETSPNPMVGAVVVKDGQTIGSGWHHRAGLPHAEVEALRDADAKGNSTIGAELYVTLEPCSTHGRTPPCTDAIIRAGIKRVVVAATDPNPKHRGCGFEVLRRAGVQVDYGICATEAETLNAGFNHWIVHRTPWVTLKAAMTLDGKIATTTGESKWITSPESRREAMKFRQQADAILAGVGTIIADDPALTMRIGKKQTAKRRLVIDPTARIPLVSQILNDPFARQTSIIVSPTAPADRVEALREKCRVIEIPVLGRSIDLREVMILLGGEDVTHLLVEGGGTTHAEFLQQHQAHAIAFFYAPKVFGGKNAPRAVNGTGFRSLAEAGRLENSQWKCIGSDMLLTAVLGGCATN